MDITRDDLPSIQDDPERFKQFFEQYAMAAMGAARLMPRLAVSRLYDTHKAWCEDLARVEAHEPRLADGLDHFKRCGHLTFWIRRMSPVVEAIDLTKNFDDSPGYPLSSDETEFRDLLFAYVNEYLAFDLGYQFCSFYETSKDGGSDRAKNLVLDRNYLRMACHFLRYKTVSPHALSLMFKSLFHPTTPS